MSSVVKLLTYRRRPLVLATGLFAILLPFFSPDEYITRLIIISGIYVILSLGLNLVTGYAGQFCLGWAAFYGVGAYTSALLALKLDWSFWVTMPIAGVMAVLFGILLGIPTMRLSGNYFAIATLGFGEITRLVMLNWTDLTRGAMGLPGIPAPSLFGVPLDNSLFYYYLIGLLVVLSVAAMHRIIDSRLGRALIAIREDELAANSAGINVTAYKITAFALGAFFAGIAGSFYAHYTSFIDPHSFAFAESIAVLAMVVLGGMGSIWGSVAGAIVLTILPELLREISEYRLIVYGFIMVMVTLLRPQGLFGRQARRKKERSRVQGGGVIDTGDQETG